MTPLWAALLGLATLFLLGLAVRLLARGERPLQWAVVTLAFLLFVYALPLPTLLFGPSHFAFALGGLLGGALACRVDSLW